MQLGPLWIYNVKKRYWSGFKLQRELIELSSGDWFASDSIFKNFALDDSVVNLINFTTQIILHVLSARLSLYLVCFALFAPTSFGPCQQLLIL